MSAQLKGAAPRCQAAPKGFSSGQEKVQSHFYFILAQQPSSFSHKFMNMDFKRKLSTLGRFILLLLSALQSQGRKVLSELPVSY